MRIYNSDKIQSVRCNHIKRADDLCLLKTYSKMMKGLFQITKNQRKKKKKKRGIVWKVVGCFLLSFSL